MNTLTDVPKRRRRADDPDIQNIGPMRDHRLTRREWLIAAPGAAAVVSAFSLGASGMDNAPMEYGPVHAEFPSHDPAIVRDVVAASHFDVDRVRTLVTGSPALAKSAWDWGFGDWESALGAASHMGRRDIAEVLITHGARADLFTFAMYGQLDVVRACVTANPGIQRTPGPHGITLLQHARNGGPQAEPVVVFLEKLGDADIGQTSLELSEKQPATYIGRYVFGKGEDGSFEVLKNRRGMLAIKRGSRFARTLHRVEEHGFAPGGAPDVRVRFDVRDGQAVSLTIHDPTPMLHAARTE